MRITDILPGRGRKERHRNKRGRTPLSHENVIVLHNAGLVLLAAAGATAEKGQKELSQRTLRNAIQVARLAGDIIEALAGDNKPLDAAARAQNSTLQQAARQTERAIQHRAFQRIPQILAAATQGPAASQD